MKKTVFAMVLGVALLSPAITSAANPVGNQGCSIFNLKACQKKATPMPEPGSMMMLASGLLGLVGYARARRK